MSPWSFTVYLTYRISVSWSHVRSPVSIALANQSAVTSPIPGGRSRHPRGPDGKDARCPEGTLQTPATRPLRAPLLARSRRLALDRRARRAGAAPHPGAEAAWLPPTQRAATHSGASPRVRGFGVPGDQIFCSWTRLGSDQDTSRAGSRILASRILTSRTLTSRTLTPRILTSRILTPHFQDSGVQNPGFQNPDVWNSRTVVPPGSWFLTGLTSSPHILRYS